MRRTSQVERMPTLRTYGAGMVMVVVHLIPARPAHHRCLIQGHGLKCVVAELIVAPVAREEFIAPRAFVRDDIALCMPVRAATCYIDVNPVDGWAVFHRA